ncbi:MAG: translocation/assembly module TamB domain-containing protein [Pseudomonadota bacterium]
MDEPSAPTTAVASATPSAPIRRRRVGVLVIATLLGVVLALLIALVTGGWWALRSERGSAWLASVLPGVQIEGAKGRLIGDFSARRVTIPLPGGSDTVTLSDVAWRGLRIERAAAPLWARVTLESLEVQRIDLALAPSRSTEPIKAPADLALPIELEVRALRVGELHAAALGAQPLRELGARVHLGANDGAEHRIDQLTLAWDQLTANGHLRIASGGRMALDSSIALAQQAAESRPAWNASATLAGPIKAPVLNATLRADPVATAGAQGPAQTLDARATLRPFAAWPLGDLQASTQALDLSAFASAAPVTALTARAVATSTAADQPASVSIDLTNALPGRWNEGRLPLRSATLELAARPDQPRELELRAFTAELGTPQASAGRIRGDGRWSPARWNLAATLSALQPALLDARAPAMQLSGPLTLAGGASTDPSVDIQTTLAGAVTERGAVRNVQLTLDAAVHPQRIELRELLASAGGARASVGGLITQAGAAAPWLVKAQAALVDFDPAVWWPGADASPWRNANHKLNATGQVDLSLPAQAATQPLLELLAALRGQAAVTLDKSLLAGVPLTGAASLRSSGGAQAIASLKLDADGNALRADGRLATSGNGSADAWDLSIDGPALAKLAPVFKLFQRAGADPTLAGTLNAKAHVTGRWPAMTTTGQLDASALRAGALNVQKAQATWTLGTSASAPVEASVTLTQATLTQGAAPGPSIDTLSLQLKGTGRAHTLDLRAESTARPPAWAESLQGGAASAAGSRTVAVVQAQGGIIDAAGNALAGWRGTIQQIDLRNSNPGSAPLLRTRNVALEALWAGAAPRASVQPGRAELLGGAVSWSRIAWQAAAQPGGFTQIEAEAKLEPLRIAPLLARAQPDFGWGGDLTVAGRVKIRSAPTFAADVVLERGSGDLTVTDEIGTRALGLTDLRFGLNADNGTWSFTQGLAGKALGVVAGAEVVRTSPQATWPAADAALSGVLELRVDDLGTWGPWVPPGWRLGGALHTSASFGGRFGAPEYTGRIEGTRLSVRNFLEGVNVSDGDVAIALRGSSARIDRFSAKAGGGSIRLEGDASLGEAPKAVLKVTAEKFQLLGRVDRRIVASGAGQLQLDKDTRAFDGRFDIDEGLIDFTRSDAPSLSTDVHVVREKGVPSPAAAASAAAAPSGAPSASVNPPRAVALDLRVTLGEQLRLRGRGLDAKLRGELRVTSPAGRLAVNGTVRVTDGTYAAYGQKLTIDRGLIAFSGAVENPRLDIEATRPNIDTRVGVIISGTPANPRVRLFSEPELSEIDKLSWLVMGRASDGLGRTDTALLQRAALALLAGEGGGPTDQLTKALGLDDISVRQTDGEVRDTVIALGKQLSKRWYVGYERGLNATTGSFQLIYRIAQRFTLRAQSGDDNSLDLIWTWRWK